MSLIKLLSFPLLGDERGGLVSVEKKTGLPFEIKRVYYLYDTPENVTRGMHAHKELKQVAIAVKGSCKFILDDGIRREEVILDSPKTGLLIESFMWREMKDFSEDCLLMVLASEEYDESDYIRDYEKFQKEVVKNDSPSE